ncbi:MAG TPA: ATP-binding protein [Candidatus Limnocylindrales bacterium]|nr:ATP-binding protein [Candidatus Limnocylindrales bacterium]
MPQRTRSSAKWIDLVWILLLAGLAVLPPVDEIHKQIILLAIAILQLFEGKLIELLPSRGPSYSVLLKILLCTLLLDHTGDMAINSAYYPIYYLPVITAAMEFGTIATFVWTTITSLAYCSLLIPALGLPENEITAEGATYLALRILFFYIAALLVNRFAVENRNQVRKSQQLLVALEESNRQLQRAEAEARRAERLAALGQLSAGLAHEIRNPLGVIKGSAEMLAQKLQPSQPLNAELAGYISSEVNRLNALVARFLDFARPQRVDLQPVQIAQIVDRALESVQNQLPNADVKVERAYAPNLPEIHADPQLCDRIFVNLILNAFQAMAAQRDSSPARERLLRLAISPDSVGGVDGVCVVVEDTGPGVPPELREQIFNPFFTSKPDGVGLGLAIVAKFVDDHRGSIRFEPGSSGGARFRVFLPLNPPPSK